MENNISNTFRCSWGCIGKTIHWGMIFPNNRKLPLLPPVEFFNWKFTLTIKSSQTVNVNVNVNFDYFISWEILFETLPGALAKSVLDKISTEEWSFPIIEKPHYCHQWSAWFKSVFRVVSRLNEIYIFIHQPNLHGFNLSDSIRLNLMGGVKFWSKYFHFNINCKVFSFQYKLKSIFFSI